MYFLFSNLVRYFFTCKLSQISDTFAISFYNSPNAASLEFSSLEVGDSLHFKQHLIKASIANGHTTLKAVLERFAANSFAASSFAADSFAARQFRRQTVSPQIVSPQAVSLRTVSPQAISPRLVSAHDSFTAREFCRGEFRRGAVLTSGSSKANLTVYSPQFLLTGYSNPAEQLLAILTSPGHSAPSFSKWTPSLKYVFSMLQMIFSKTIYSFCTYFFSF